MGIQKLACLWLILGLIIPTWNSGTLISEALTCKEVLPDWFMSPVLSGSSNIAPEVLRAMETSGEDTLRVIVVLHVPALPREDVVPSAPADKGIAFVQHLQHTHTQAKAEVDNLLAHAEAAGNLLARRDLWIINGIALTARPVLIRQLSNSPSVAEIRLDHYQQYIEPSDADASTLPAPDAPTWGVTQIRAPEVWQTLAVSGTGAVVAVLDTGAEYVHPAVSQRYRGYLGNGMYDHSIAWFDAVNGGVYPYDDHGHGTHVAGTMVGAQHIGVAPAAQWIAVKVLNHDGYGYESWIHAGFQWLLAPGGDLMAAPDVINASWSSSNASNRIYEPDIQALQAAGIFVVFSSGNSGPSLGTVGSPASLPGVFAVGASDQDDDVTSFSSRGPSPWGEVKPAVVAPGVDVVSSLPGGLYKAKNGTSMAAPHVAGVVALMRAVSPTLSITRMTHILTSTSVPLTVTVPNNNSGWGRVDAFAAVAAVVQPSVISGSVRAVGLPHGLTRASVVAAPHAPPFGKTALDLTDAQGQYELFLLPGTYDLTASAFGYASQTYWNVHVLTESHQMLNFNLFALSTGKVWGQLRVPEVQAPLTRPVTISVLDTSFSVQVAPSEYYTFSLPRGTYVLEARGLGYRTMTTVVTIADATAMRYDFEIATGPTVLLVDQGSFDYRSQVHYWEQALLSLSYAYDKVRIKQLEDVPISTTLANYDVVLWSAPVGSPGLVDAAPALHNYLENEGNLFLSGQDVAYFDAGGSAGFGLRPYLYGDMNVAYEKDMLSRPDLVGLGTFSGLTATITGEDGANNQIFPAAVRIVERSEASPLWQYTQGGLGGVGTSVCVPYRSLFFGFGYEAISGADQRREVMARSLDWLTQSPAEIGLELSSLSASTLIQQAGHTLTHTLRLRHIGYAGRPETIAITLQGDQWPTTISPTYATLSPCTSVTLTVFVTIPHTAGVHQMDKLTVVAQSLQSSAVETALVKTKTPAPLLLVDDDRWYAIESYYISVLASQGIPYDRWDTKASQPQSLGTTKLTPEILNRYPMVVWFTGCDWYQPIVSVEETYLVRYLEDGGRLLLSSQDFLYYHAGGDLAHRFGVLRWNEGQPATFAASIPERPAVGIWGPVELDFLCKNWSDVVEPSLKSFPLVRGELGQPLALAKDESAVHKGKSLFYAFPLETLPFEARVSALEQGVGWLSALGNSQWVLTPTHPMPGERVTSTLVLYNDDSLASEVAISHTLHPSLTLAMLSHPSQTLNLEMLHYAAASRALTWTGVLSPAAPLTLTWAMTVHARVGDKIVPTTTFALPKWKFAFDRALALHVAGPDLSTSHWLSPTGAVLQVSHPETLSFLLHNTGPGDLVGGEARIWMMRGLSPLTVTVPPTRGMEFGWWKGDLKAGERLTLAMPIYLWNVDPLGRVDALLQDKAGQRWEKRLWLSANASRIFLPLVWRMR